MPDTWAQRQFNGASRNPRRRWGQWLGMAVAIALLGGFCLWIYVSVQSEVVRIPSDAMADCQNAPDSAAVDSSKFAAFKSENTKGEDNGHVCLLSLGKVAH